MPVNTADHLHQTNSPNWLRLRTCFNGEDAIKAQGQRYLRPFYPGMAVQEIDRWRHFLQGAEFTNIVKRVHGVLSGALLRAEPTFSLPEDLESFTFQEFGTANTGIHSLIQEAISEDILTGRTGVLVEVAEDGGSPYPTVWRAENILGVTGSVIEGEQTYTNVRLRMEVMRPLEDDPYITEPVEQVLELLINEEGQYVQRLWEAIGKDFSIVRESLPTDFSGSPLTRIPFWMLNGDATETWAPLSDIAISNIHLYNKMSYQAWAYYQHNTPTYILSGVSDDDAELYLGGVFRSSNPEARLEVLSGASDVLRSSQAIVDQTLNTIASQGANMFSQRGVQSQVESGKALQIRNTPDHTVVSALALSYSATFTSILRFAVEWATGRLDESISVSIHNSIDSDTIDSQTLVAVITGVVNGAVPPEAMYEALDRAELLPSDFNPIADLDRLENEAPEPADEI